MTETPDEAVLRKAKAVAWALGITVYIRDGGVYQHEPGIKIEPPPGSHPEQAGRGPIDGSAAPE
jgi:hypothetical protein